MKEFNCFEGKITVKKGEVFDVTLESQVSSTGYGWALSSMPNCLNLLEVAYVSTSSSVVGGKGNQVYRFAAVAEAEACLEFSLCRAWEPLKIVEKKVYHVIVTDQVNCLENSLRSSMGKDKFLSSNAVKPKTTCEQSPVIPYGVPVGVVEDRENCIMMYAVPYGLAQNIEDCVLKYGIPASIVEDECNCVVEYGIPLGKAKTTNECILKYGSPIPVHLLYGIPFENNDKAHALYKSASTGDIVVAYGIPSLKYGIVAANLTNVEDAEACCFTPIKFIEDECNCVVKYGIPQGIPNSADDCVLKYGAPVLNDKE